MFPRKLATEFCVSTKTPFRIFVFPPNVKRDFVFPRIFVSALKPRYVSSVNPLQDLGHLGLNLPISLSPHRLSG